LARRLGVAGRVRFAGYHADMREVYCASDFLVHPTFYDPCSNVVLEALLCGLPVVTSRHNGAAELLTRADAEGRCAEGFVLPEPHDHARLAGCMNELIDPKRRRQCAAAARAAAEGWTFEDHYQALVGVLAAAARPRAA
jgi:UDP-glucose:(heptosyl)LPS alpha-1,3-glucosyltransferase